MPDATYAQQFDFARNQNVLDWVEAKMVQFAQYVKANAAQGTDVGGANHRTQWVALADEVINGNSALKAARMALLMGSATAVIQTIKTDIFGNTYSDATEVAAGGQLENLWDTLAMLQA